MGNAICLALPKYCIPEAIYEIPVLVYALLTTIYLIFISKLKLNGVAYRALNYSANITQIGGLGFFAIITIQRVDTWVPFSIYAVIIAISSVLFLLHLYNIQEIVDFTIFLNFAYIFLITVIIVCSWVLEFHGRYVEGGCKFEYRSAVNVIFSNIGIPLGFLVFMKKMHKIAIHDLRHQNAIEMTA